MLLERTVQTVRIGLEDVDKGRGNDRKARDENSTQTLGYAILEYSIKLVKMVDSQSAVQALRQLLNLVMQHSLYLSITFLNNGFCLDAISTRLLGILLCLQFVE